MDGEDLDCYNFHHKSKSIEQIRLNIKTKSLIKHKLFHHMLLLSAEEEEEDMYSNDLNIESSKQQRFLSQNKSKPLLVPG